MEETGDMNLAVEEEAEALHVRRKDIDRSVQIQPDSHNVMCSTSAFTAPKSDWGEPLSLLMLSPDEIAEAFGDKSQLRSASSLGRDEPPSSSPCAVTDSGTVVEELTLNNFRNANSLAPGCSSRQEPVAMRKGQWNHLYRLAGGFRIGNSHVGVASREPEYGEGDGNNRYSAEWSVEQPPPDKFLGEVYNRNTEHLIRSSNCTISSNTCASLPEGIRTKFLPSSGFSHFMVKNTLKGKGVVFRKLQTHEAHNVANQVQECEKAVSNAEKASNKFQVHSGDVHNLSFSCGSEIGAGIVSDGVTLREWIQSSSPKFDKVERMLIFKQILELVDNAHCQGVALQDVRPSCFMILPSNKVRYIGSWGLQIQAGFPESVGSREPHLLQYHPERKRSVEQDTDVTSVISAKQQKLSGPVKLVGRPYKSNRDDTNRMRARNSNLKELQTSDHWHEIHNASHGPSISKYENSQLTSVHTQLEARWYMSPEALNDRVCTLESNIYSLGILLFELFCCFRSFEVHAMAMSDLRHRILPPYFLAENSKEAGFCLWLLHPDPSCRPKTREILQSGLICEGRGFTSENQSSLSVDEEDAESEMLLYFLLSLKELKNKQVSQLVEKVECLNADIEEIEKRLSLRTMLISEIQSGLDKKDALLSSHDGSDQQLCDGSLSPNCAPRPKMDETRLLRNMKQIEKAYFSVRSEIDMPETDTSLRTDIDVLKSTDSQQNDTKSSTDEKPPDRLGAFFNGLCKYASYNKFEVRGMLRNADLFNSPNVICSLSFDRDEDYFAAAGVSKKIKIFEFSSLLNNTVDIHYPVVEMACKSKLSCVCWNSYISNYLASTDYDGVVQLWDASTGQWISQYNEHQRRAWSVDFSRIDPKKLASGSDDCSVKLWSINELNSTSTIGSAANVCCVQFSSHSSHLLAFGSADYKIHCYDLRKTRFPWCTLAGHGKAVSYVKFIDPCTLVSASTDSTLKIWDLNKTISSGISTNACSLSLSGHTNEKNFVGLTVSDGYIACGSETNEVFVYYQSLPMPVTSHKFGSVDPISAQEIVDGNGQFVSSVCWRGNSDMVIAANSNGSIKLLQMV